MADLARCELCNEYFEAKDMQWFRLKSGTLIAADRDWWLKAGTRHVCRECVEVMTDPFAEGKAIRRGEGEIPDYEVITGWLQRVSLSWLPGLLAQVVTCCVVRGVFQEGKLLPYVQRAELLANDPTSVLRKE